MSDLTLYDRNCREKEAQLLANLQVETRGPIDAPLTDAQKQQVVIEYGVVKNKPLCRHAAGLTALWCFFLALCVFVAWFNAAFLPLPGVGR